MKSPLIPPGIEPATFRFVAQHMCHCGTAVPVKKHRSREILRKKKYINKFNPFRFKKNIYYESEPLLYIPASPWQGACLLVSKVAIQSSQLLANQ